MTTFNSALAAAALVLAIGFSGAASAAAVAKTAKVHSPESIECSKQADAKGLHGKERKTFRSACKKQIEGKSATTKAPDVKAPDKKS